MFDDIATKEVPAGVESFLAVGGIVLISTLFIIFFLNIKKNKGKFLPIFIGIIGYIVFCLLGYNVVASLIMAIPGIRELYNDNATSIMIVLAIITALMFTLARMVTVKVLKINGYSGKGNFYNAGIGLSIGNIIIFGISLISLLVWCNAISSEGLTAIFESIGSEDEALATWESIQPLLNYKPSAWFVMSLSYAIDILLYASLMWVDGCAMLGKLPKIWHFYGGIINFIVILPFDLYDGKEFMGYVIPFIIKFAFMVAAVCIIAKFTGKIDDEEVMKRNNKKMPKIGNLSKL